LEENKVSPGVHRFSSLMVCGWSYNIGFLDYSGQLMQQTPAGFIIQNNRAELTDFWAAVFNPSTMVRFLHTVDAA